MFLVLYISVDQAIKNRIYISPVDTARVCVNGKAMQPSERKELQHNDRVIMGMNHVFVVCSRMVSPFPTHLHLFWFRKLFSYICALGE